MSASRKKWIAVLTMLALCTSSLPQTASGVASDTAQSADATQIGEAESTTDAAEATQSNDATTAEDATTGTATADATAEAEKQALYESIMKSLAETASTEDVKKQLEAIKQQASLNGDTALQSYAEYMEQILDLQQQIQDLQGLIAGLQYNTPEIATLDEALQSSMALDMTLADVLTILPEDVRGLLTDLDVSSAEGYQACYAEILGIIAESTKNVVIPPETSGADVVSVRLAAVPAADRAYFAVLLLQLAQDGGLLTASETQDACMQRLAAQLEQAYNSYTGAQLDALKAVSDQFQDCGKYADTIDANHLVVIGEQFSLKKAPICYKDQILISMQDIANYLNGTVQQSETSDAVSMQAGTLLMEVQKGESVCYINDVTYALQAPVLWFQDQTYVTADVLAQAMGATYIALPKQHCFIIRT